MTKNFFCACLVFTTILCLLLTGCKKENEDDGTKSSSGIGSGAKIAIVLSDYEQERQSASKYSSLVAEIHSALFYGEAMYDLLLVTEQHDTVCDYEIVVGKTGRDISTMAYEKLERIKIGDKKAEEYVLGYGRYIIYAKDGNIAIAYDDDDYLAAASVAVELLISKYLCNGVLKVHNGVLETGVVDYYTFLSEKDQEELDLEWSAIRSRLGNETCDALQSLYELYTDDLISWIANLWEPYTCVCETEECTHSSPYCGGGAFYFSNSGRNTQGYLPDAESTRQILAMMESCGLIESYGKDLPDSMKSSIIRFMKSLQDPESGYFYHPQWGSDISDARRGRDLTNCTEVLRRLGSAPTYNAPNGTSGDGILADGTKIDAVSPVSALTTRLSDSVAVKVSAIKPAATTPSHLLNRDAFEKYLASLKIRENSYSAGNDLSAQMSEIKQRDAELKAQGADYSLVDIVVNFLNENQNPSTGTWDWYMANDTRSAYHANNGVLKITLVYNAAGVQVPNYEKILDNAVDTLMLDDMPDAMTDIYNIWFAISCIKDNISIYGGDGGTTHAKKFQKELLERAPTLITKTKEKLAIFLKPDGSFSYFPKYSTPTASSAPVSVPQTEEGDVDATTIAVDGTIDTMFNALGLVSIKPKIYTSVDYMRFCSIIDELDRVIKDELPPFEVVTSGDENKGKGKYYDQALSFDNDRFSDLVHSGIFSSEGDAINWDRLGVGVFASNTSVNGDKVMVYGKKIAGSPHMYIDLMNGKNGNAIVFETDICLIGGSTNYDDGSVLQFWLDDSNREDTVMWWNGSFYAKQEQSLQDEDGYPIGQHSFTPTMKTHVFTNGTWHNIRLEVEDSSKVGSEIRFYVDNVLVNRRYISTANTDIDHLTLAFRGDSVTDSIVLFDNMFLGTFEKIATDKTPLYPDNIVIGDYAYDVKNEAIRGTGVYAQQAQTYNNTNLTTLYLLGEIGSYQNKVTLDTITGGYYAAIRRVVGNEAMVFGKTTSADPFLYTSSVANENADDYSMVYETDFALMSGTAPGRSDKIVMQWIASPAQEGNSFWYNMTVQIMLDNGNYYLKAGTSAQNVTKKISAATWYNIRLEADDVRTTGSKIRVYLNGEQILEFATTGATNYVERMTYIFTSQCIDGTALFDNTYFRGPKLPPPPPTVNTPEENVSDNYGNGVYYESAEKYTGRTHQSLIEDGIMSENTVRGVGDQRVLTFEDGCLKYSSTGSSFGSLNFVKQTGNGEGLVFETDIKLDNLTGSATRPITFYGSSNYGTGSASLYAFNLTIYPYSDSEIGGYYVSIANCSYLAWIPDGVWVNLRYEFDSLAPGATTRLYVNGEKLLETTSKTSIADIKSVELYTQTTSGGTGFVSGSISIDNTYLSLIKVDTESEEPEVTPPGGDEPEITPPEGNDPDEDETDNGYRGTGVYLNSAEKYDGKSYSSLSSFITEVKNHWTKEESVTDGALRINSKESGEENYSFLNLTTPTEDYVFETDFRIVNLSTQRDITFLLGSNASAVASLYGMGFNITQGTGENEGYFVLKANRGTNEFNLGLATDSAEGDSGWLNIRYEVDGLAEGSAVRFIVNGEVIEEMTANRAIANVVCMQMTLLGTYNGVGPVGNFYFDNTYLGDKKSQDLTAEN